MVSPPFTHPLGAFNDRLQAERRFEALMVFESFHCFVMSCLCFPYPFNQVTANMDKILAILQSTSTLFIDS